jgi:hypothetical protein
MSWTEQTSRVQVRQCMVYVGLKSDWRPAETKPAPVCEACIDQQRRRGDSSAIESVGAYLTANHACRFCKGAA